VLSLFCITISVCAQTNDNYSLKDRWTLKASIARYKTAFWGTGFAYVGDNFDPSQCRKMANFKVETNYGFNKFIEIGIFVGFQHYEWYNDFSYNKLNKSLAPLFGVNANFHILPFFVKSKNCHWDLYLTTKYGGCYLPHKEFDDPVFQVSKYRQEYGLGLGIGYYFKNVIGLFAEGSVGQYFFFKRIEVYSFKETSYELKDYTDSNFSFRIGIAAKF
jgi:hypothetical protein